MSAPNAKERAKCYNTRDRYFMCKASHDNSDSACAEEKKDYHSSCPAAWVKYFARKQIYDEYKKKLNTEGFKLEDS